MRCGCFCCLQTCAASAVIDWIDDGDTPLCPLRGIAAVLAAVTDRVELFRPRERRFGAYAGRLLPDEAG